MNNFEDLNRKTGFGYIKNYIREYAPIFKGSNPSNLKEIKSIEGEEPYL